MLLDDVRFALRSLTRQKLFTTTAVLVAGVGLGVVIAFFSVANGVLFAPLPYPDDDRLVAVSEERAGDFTAFSAVSPVARDLLRREAGTLDIGSFRHEQLPVRIGLDPVVRDVVRTDERTFSVLGTPPALGRALGPGDAGRPVAVLSHGTWQRLFAGERDVLGRTIRIDGEAYAVVGVMPPRFNISTRGGAELFLPFADGAQGPEEARTRNLSVVGRLRPDVTREAATGELARLRPALRDVTGTEASLVLRSEPVERGIFFGGVIWLFIGAAGLLLLVTCSNVGGLLLARASRRRSEAAIRAALGGSASRIFRQGMLESLLLATAASATGLLAGAWLADLFRAVLPAGLPWWADVTVMDGRVVAFAVLATGLTVLLIGTAPSLEAARIDLRGALSAGATGATATPRARRLRSLTVGVQLALAFVLVATSVMGWRGTRATARVDLGWPADEVLLLPVEMEEGTPVTEARANVLDPVEERIRELPAVEGLAWSAFPLGVDGTGFARDATVGPAGEEGRPIWTVERNAVSADYFDVSGIPLVEGRPFEAGGGPAVIVNETLARAYWGGGPAVGQRLRLGDVSLDVVGVASDVRSLRGGRGGMRTETEPALYLPIEETAPLASPTLRIRTREPERVAEAVRATAASVLPERGIPEIRTAEEAEIGPTLATASFLSSVFLFFAVLAVLFSSAGLYALIAYSVARRTREIGIRTALGADRGRVVAAVMGHALRLSVVALLVGAVIAGGRGHPDQRPLPRSRRAGRRDARAGRARTARRRRARGGDPGPPGARDRPGAGAPQRVACRTVAPPYAPRGPFGPRGTRPRPIARATPA